MEIFSQIEKVARAKNNPDELSFIGKTVGSNFFLSQLQLLAVFRQPYEALCAPPTAQSSLASESWDSFSVGVPGIEPSASRSQSERSTDELHPVVDAEGFEPPTFAM